MTNPSSADASTPATTPASLPQQQQASSQSAGAEGSAPPAPSVADYPDYSTERYPTPATSPTYQSNPQPAPYPQQPYSAAPSQQPQPFYPQPQPAQYPAYQPYSQPPTHAPQPTPYQPQPQQTPYPQQTAYPSYAPPAVAPAPPHYQPPHYQPPTPPQRPYAPQYAPQPPTPGQPVQLMTPGAQGLQGGGAPTRFEPQLGMQLQIGEARFGFMPHPIFGAEMDEVYVVEGGEALIYQLQDVATGALYALKVMKPSYRGEEIARSVASLLPYATQPGLQLGNRVCLTRSAYPALVGALPDLEYAVLMPWLTGRTWAGLLSDRAASETYYAADALRVALRTAQALWELEAHHMAHTDVASGNVMLLSEKGEIALLDVETLYMPRAPAPRFQRLGTPGYQHPRLDARGQWRPDGDRFAGAILLAEMLSWWDPTVRALTPDGAETLFSPQELQSLTLPRWQAVRDALWNLCPLTLALFDQAWASADLADCSELGAWAMVLLQQSAF